MFDIVNQSLFHYHLLGYHALIVSMNNIRLFVTYKYNRNPIKVATHLSVASNITRSRMHAEVIKF